MRNKIDFIKGLAIIGVIMVHTIPGDLVKKWQLAFSFNQQVPIFILISGITFTLSFDRKEIFKNLNWRIYLEYLKNKMKNIVIPIGITFLISSIIYLVLNKNSYGFGIKNFLMMLPAEGAGNYYILLLIQLIIVMPIIYYLVNKYNNKAIIGIFFVNLAMETIFCNMSIFSDYYLYKASILRYFGALGLGILIAKDKEKKSLRKRLMLYLAPISLGYIYLVNNFDFKFNWIYEKSWHQQNIFTFFYVGMMVSVLLKYVSDDSQNIVWKSICKFGKNSFYIFLAQILYFSISLSLVDEVFLKILKVNNLFLVYTIALSLDFLFCYIGACIIKKIEKKIKKITVGRKKWDLQK